MLTQASIFKGVRTELGDLTESFRDTYRATGDQAEWDLSARNISASTVQVMVIEGTASNVIPPSGYTLDTRQGIIRFPQNLPEDALVVVSGDSYGILSDDELEMFVHAALSQHLKGRTVQRRYRNGNGFITYDREQMGLEDVPGEEEILIILLTTIEALWALSTDAALDIDVQTAEGTSIPRGQRYRQITAQIDLLTDKYKELAAMMGVGLFAPEVFTMRRVSRSTGRLVPIFAPREYDENGPAIRVLPPARTRDTDPDGPASPLYPGWGT